jgi:peptidoglycan hydrolase-like protein with peptidoglycan-binding domain
MGKTGVIVTLSLTMVSGCTSFDSADTVVDKLENPVAAIENGAAPVSDPAVIAPVIPAPVVESRRLAPDDIRRLQLRLRGVGFDPGPIDGVAGAKTKAAFRRFESGCVQVSGLLDANATRGRLNTNASRQETLSLQTQLRDAGFNPGPIDGIFGSRTKALVDQLQNDCPITKEFAAFFDRTEEVAANGSFNAEPAQRLIPERPTPTLGRFEAAKQSATPVSAKPHEDIRILQLRLRDAGFDPGPFDGIMGPKTRLAMQQFRGSQRAGKNNSVLMLGTNGQY